MLSKDSASDEEPLMAIHKVLERVPSMLAYWDTNLRCRFANQAYKSSFGVDADGLVGTSLVDLLGSELFALNEPYIRAALRGEAQSFQRVVPGPDGVQRNSLAHYLPDIVDGQVHGFVVQVTDDTPLKDVEAALRAEAVERERATHLLRKSEAALKQAQRLVRIGSWHWEVSPDITSWSEELYRIFGRDPTRLPPSYAEHAQLYSPPSWLTLQAAVARTLSVGEPYVLELEYVRPDGTTGWVEARGEAERDEQGAIIGLHGTAQEITARRDARLVQRQLQTSEHFRERLEALTPGVVHIFDLELQRNVYISRSVASLLGYSAWEVQAMGEKVLETLMHPEDRQRFPEHLQRICQARDNETTDFEFRMRNRAGEWRWFQSRDAVFSRDDHGAVRELIGTAIDIDSRKQGELALRREMVERQAAQELLHRSEERYRRMLDTAHEGIWTIDAEGRTTYVNQHMSQLLGYAPEELMGRVHTDFMWEEDRPKGDADLELRRSNVPRVWDQRYRRKDSSELWTVASCSSIIDDDGRFAGALGMFTDITERKRTEEALRQSSAMLRAIGDSTGDAIFAKDIEGRLTYANPATLELIGKPADQVLGRTDAEFLIDPLIAQQIMGNDHRIMAHGVGEEVEEVVPTPDGTPRIWLSRKVPYRNADGVVVGMLGVSRDITVRKRQEEALRESEQRFRIMADGLPLLVWVHDAAGDLQFVNQTYREFFAVTNEQIAGQNWRPLVHPDDVAAYAEEFVTCVQARRAFHAEARVRRADGEWRWIESRARPRLSPAGEFLGMVGCTVDVTERKRSEAQLHLLDRAVAASDAGVFIVDPHAPDFPIVFASEGFERLTGYSASDVMGLNCRFLQGRDTDAATVARLREAVHTHRPVREALINYRKDGTPFWNDIAISPVTDEKGRVTHLVGIQNDVSAMYALQAALQESTDRLALGVEVAKLALAEIDYDSGLAHLTPEAAIAFGLGQAALVLPREKVHATFHHDDRDELARRIAECLDPEGPGWFAMDHRIVWSDSSVRWLMARKQVFFAGAGEARRPQRAVLAVRDVTEQKAVEARLRDTLTRVQLATEATAVGIWEWNVLTNTIRWDAQMFQLYGIPPTANGVLPYSDWTAAVVPEDLAHQQQILQDTARRGGRSRREFRIRRRDNGQVRDIEAVEAARRNDAGVVEWVLGTNLDITERKDTERQLQRAAAALTDADRRKDEFLATLSHELRNPLAPLSNSVELLKRAPGDVALIERARATMERQVAQLGRLIDDLLDVSRITRDKITLKRESIFLSDVVHDAVEICQPHFDRAEQTLKLTLPPSAVPLHADAARLVQVLGNLLNNASKFTPKGGHVELVAESHSGRVAVRVRDNGIGIPADMQPRVFDLFAQVDASRDLSKGGLGIGLALAKRLVEMHGGTISVASEGLGRGSEFVVTLPTMPMEQGLAAARDGSGNSAKMAAKRVLVVDDNRDSAESMALLLELEGHQTLTARDGLEALDKAATFQPDVILLDIGLPNLDGFEVCRRLREQPWTRNALIIAMTGWGQADDLRKAAHAGFDHHCVKPVDHDALKILLMQGGTARE